MSDLIFDSLRITNFRALRDLTVEQLGRVNLIVGKNNVGKTTLLGSSGSPAYSESSAQRYR